MFNSGFISSAPLFMDIVTIYFSLLPILLVFAISLAKQKKYNLHMISQMGIYILTMIFVVIFEVCIRVYGGFGIFLEQSNTDKEFFLIVLAIHILIALISFISWTVLNIKTYLAYKKDGFKAEIFKKHRFKAILVFLGMFLTSYSGTYIYYLLFLN